MDVERVCCMCGDVGFPDKIFRCMTCHHRFQHWYCSNYYRESSEPMEVCDWCRTDETKTSKVYHSESSKKLASKFDAGIKNRSKYCSGDTIKRYNRRQHDSNKGKPPTGAPSLKTSTRRFKLLKDVMC